jgi:hypothetical protein
LPIAVFVSFLTGLLAMARFSLNEGKRALLAVNAVAIVAVGFTLAINLGRGYPLAALAAALLIAPRSTQCGCAQDGHGASQKPSVSPKPEPRGGR